MNNPQSGEKRKRKKKKRAKKDEGECSGSDSDDDGDGKKARKKAKKAKAEEEKEKREDVMEGVMDVAASTHSLNLARTTSARIRARGCTGRARNMCT